MTDIPTWFFVLTGIANIIIAGILIFILILIVKFVKSLKDTADIAKAEANQIRQDIASARAGIRNLATSVAPAIVTGIFQFVEKKMKESNLMNDESEEQEVPIKRSKKATKATKKSK